MDAEKMMGRRGRPEMKNRLGRGEKGRRGSWEEEEEGREVRR